MALNLDADAKFCWCFGCDFLLETAEGNFIWSNPDYPGGDNTIKKFDGGLNEFLADQGTEFARNKGKHVIREYCGENVIVIDDEK